MEKSHQSVCLKKCNHVKTILKNPIQKKKTKHTPLVIQYLQISHLAQKICTQQKINLILTEGKTAWESFVKT